MGLINAMQMIGKIANRQPQQTEAQLPTPAALPQWFNNPAMMQGGMAPMTPPINPMGGPGGQAPMQGMPFQWRGVMPRGFGG